MLAAKSERKEILAELLKLNQYDELEERAKDLSRSFKQAGGAIGANLQSMQAQLCNVRRRDPELTGSRNP